LFISVNRKFRFGLSVLLTKEYGETDNPIPEKYRRYESEPGVFEQFLLVDSEEGDDCILVFGRKTFQGF